MPADVEVQIFAAPASAGWGRLRDISISGGFIETALRIAVDATLRMKVPATGSQGVRVVHAIVVRRSTHGVGVEWFDGQSEAITTLLREVTTWQTHEYLSDEIRLEPRRA